MQPESGTANPVDHTASGAGIGAQTPVHIGGHVVLVGLMGVGKSTVGPLLADALGRTFVDLDVEVERRAGCSVRQLVLDHGESEFRRLEAEALADVLGESVPVVLATGGGAVLNPASRQLLRDVPVVIWLRASVDTLVDRVGAHGAAARPLLDDGPAQVLARLAGERDGLYREVADVEIDTTLDDAQGVAASVLTSLGELGQPVSDLAESDPDGSDPDGSDPGEPNLGESDLSGPDAGSTERATHQERVR
jgi:shikimate kinase